MKLCTELVQVVSTHKATALLVGGLAWTAFSSTFPEELPRTLDDWWHWTRDFVRQAGNVRHPGLPKAP